MTSTSRKPKATQARGSSRYTPPTVLAAFSRQELADQLPENIAPHIHSSQSS